MSLHVVHCIQPSETVCHSNAVRVFVPTLSHKPVNVNNVTAGNVRLKNSKNSFSTFLSETFIIAS